MEGILLAALVLACPVGMGLMMWMMSKGMMGGKQSEEESAGPGEPSLSELPEEHERLGAEIGRIGRAGVDDEADARLRDPAGSRAG